MTPKQEAALRQALEALDGLYLPGELERVNKAIIALREALAEQSAPVASPHKQQEPVAMRYDFDGYGYKYIDSGSGSDWQTRIKDAEPIYTSSPIEATPLTSQSRSDVKPWVGLEESEWREIDDRHDWTTTQGRIDAAEEIEAKLREKNT